MEPHTAYIALQTLVSLAILLWFLLFAIPEYRQDRFRQSLFEVRDALFDYAAAGNISFDHPAYGMLRSITNGYIRYAHKMSLLQLFAFAFLIRKIAKTGSLVNRWEKNKAGLSSDVQIAMDRFWIEIHFHLGKYLLGYWIAPIVLSVQSYIFARWCTNWYRETKEKIISSIDTAGLALGGS